MKKSLLILTVLISFTTIAQEKLNNYKYVIVPSKFDFQKTENQHGVNTLLKYKFQQLGFETYLDNEEISPMIIAQNCAILRPVLKNNGGMLTTRVVVEVKDCYNNVLFETQEGSSKIKNYRSAYSEALRNALKSFGNYRLAYAPNTVEENTDVAEIIEEEKLKEAQKEKVIEEVLLVANTLKYRYKSENYLFVKNDLMYTEIYNITTGKIVGKMIPSALKKGIYHISFNTISGFCYYSENGNLIVEYLLDDKTIQVISLPKVD